MSRFSITFSTLVICNLLFCLSCSRDGQGDVGLVEPGSQQNLYSQFAQRAQAMANQSTAQTLMPQAHNNGAAFVHSGALLEFWLFLAVLSDQQGNDYALQQRFARLNLASQPLMPVVEADQSEWNYSSVVAMDYQFHHLSSGEIESATQAQREALDLSGADADQRRVWVGAFEAQQLPEANCHPFIRVISPQLSLRFGGADGADAVCDDNRASSIVSSANFAVSRGLAQPVSGSYRSTNQDLKLSGYGWVVQGWGVPPDTSDAAVVFDRAWLLMGDDASDTSNVSVQLQRSRRASGRGPLITTGTMRNLAGGLSSKSDRVELPLTLEDGVVNTKNSLPQSWVLNGSENDLSLTLTPITDSDKKAKLLGQTSWFGLVAIEGSRRGYGFVDYSVR